MSTLNKIVATLIGSACLVGIASAAPVSSQATQVTAKPVNLAYYYYPRRCYLYYGRWVCHRPWYRYGYGYRHYYRPYYGYGHRYHYCRHHRC